MTDSNVVEPPKKRRGKVKVRPDPTAEPVIEPNGQKLVRVERTLADEPEPEVEPQGDIWDPVDDAEPEAEPAAPLDYDDEPAVMGAGLALRAPKPAEEQRPRPRTIEDVLARSDARRQQRRVPSAAELGAETVYSASPAVPHDESRPELRDKPTMGQVELRPDVPESLDARTTPRTLADLTLFLDQSGNYFIHVVRKAPRLSQGMPVTGLLRPIRHYLTDADFVQLYGGGDYELTLRGPPRRGGVIDPTTGRVRDVALTEPVKYTVPHSISPNLEAALPEDEYEEEMLPPSMPRRINSPADARIHEANLEHEERMLDRREKRERDLENKIATMPEQMAPLISTLDRANERAVDLVRDQVRREEALRREADRRAEEARNRPTDISEVGNMITGLMQAMGPRTNPEEVSRVSELAQREREQIIHSHREELKRVQESSERRASDAEERAERRIRELEERATLRVREAEERAEKVVRDARNDVDKQIRDIERTLTARLDDEKRNSERELRAQQAAADSKLETQKTAFEMRLGAKDDEISRLRDENGRLRSDLEKAKDLPEQINKFSATAESLGFTKPGTDKDDDEDEKEPQDWKTMVGQIGLNLVQGLPHMIAEARGAVRDARNAAPTGDQAYQQMYAAAGQTVPAAMAARPLVGRGGQPFVPRRLAFATDDGPAFPGEHEAPPGPPLMPNGQVAQPLSEMQQTGQQPQPAPQQRGVPMAQPPMPQPMPVPAAAPPAPPPPPAQPMPQSPQPQFSAEQLQQTRNVLEQAFEQGADPGDVARQFVQQLGAEQVRLVIGQFSPEMITMAISTLPNGALSPLVRREGSKYLRELWAELAKLVA